MDCKTARLLLNFARPLSTELEASDAEALHGHLADCPTCGPQAEAERLADDRIGQAVRAVPVPDGLRERLLARLAAERDARHWRWLRWGSGIAAALLVTGLLGWALQSRQLRPIPNPEDVGTSLVEQRGADPDLVQRAFQSQGVRTVLPRSLDYQRYLAFYNLIEFQGKTVPQLVFLNPRGESAIVRILSDQQFDLASVHQLVKQPYDSGELTVKIMTDPGNPHFAYLVIYTGGPQEWFLGDAPQPAT
jgi:hypothetical protein